MPVSSKLIENGWAVVVSGRTLYTWRYTASSVKKVGYILYWFYCNGNMPLFIKGFMKN